MKWIGPSIEEKSFQPLRSHVFLCYSYVQVKTKLLSSNIEPSDRFELRSTSTDESHHQSTCFQLLKDNLKHCLTLLIHYILYLLQLTNNFWHRFLQLFLTVEEILEVLSW